ncbi:hypothetical protein CEF21_14810 [Bacillus sp. FJAT-42376]|uniref:DUF6376 family protein n=1 Tax=Bacillus sp. FJAT-42376 TaxID=2014076 RepID=UPI000F4E588A|nr:DUF6376 family protein [Bacillus sp. FJAT-42376]AZB43470.1 hypothetical protein CEF21_14810 [Bacillus sp. FJAT-42376]
MKQLISFLALIIISLTGCSMPPKPVSYGEEASTFALELSSSAEDLSTLFYDAAESETARSELKSMLISMKDRITAFNKIQAPEQMNDLHLDLLKQNRHALQNIEEYLSAIENNTYTEDLKSNTGLTRQLEAIQSKAQEIRIYERN